MKTRKLIPNNFGRDGSTRGDGTTTDRYNIGIFNPDRSLSLSSETFKSYGEKRNYQYMKSIIINICYKS